MQVNFLPALLFGFVVVFREQKIAGFRGCGQGNGGLLLFHTAIIRNQKKTD